MRLYGVLGGGRYRWIYGLLFALCAAACALLWDNDDWNSPGLVATLVATTLALDYLSARYAPPGPLAWGVGSFAPIALAAILLGPAAAALIGAGTALFDSLRTPTRPPHIVGNVFNSFAWPLITGVAAAHLVTPLQGGWYVVAVFTVVLLSDGLSTTISAIHMHGLGEHSMKTILGYYIRFQPRAAVLALVVAGAAHGYRAGGIGVLATLMAGLVICEAFILRLEAAERALRGERAVHEKYLRMVGTAVVSLDPDLRVTLANRRALELLGLPTDEDATGRDWIELIGVRGTAHAERRHWCRMFDEPGSTDSFETELRGNVATPRIVAWHSTLVHDDDGYVTSLLLAGEDVTDQRMSERRMAYLAYNDALTGLPNRTSFDQELPAMLAEANACGCAAALLFMDLDGFKRINDRHGHEAGDRLLAEAAARLRAVADGDDLLVRRGGDEFLMLVRDLGVEPQDATAARRATGAVAERVARAFDAPFPVAGTSVRIGISVGSAIFPLDAADADGLQRAADASMYGLKQRAL